MQTAINVYNINDSCLVLKNWNIIGPFQNSEQNINLNIDNLSIFGYNENKIKFFDFVNINSNKIRNKKVLNPKFKCIYEKNEEPIININLLYDTVYAVQNANVYLGCIIRTTKEKELRLNFSSDNGAKIWLNNKLILNYDKEVSVFAYENYIPIKLLKGDNFLMVKVYNSSGDWLMYARIEEETNYGQIKHQKIITLLNNHNFFKRSIIDSLYYLQANDNLPYNDYKLAILNKNNNEVFNDTVNIRKGWKKDISFFSEGLYTAKLIINTDTLEQLIYKGNVIEKIKELIKNKKNDFNQNDKNDFDANVARFHHLLKPKNRGSNLSERQAWQKKITYLYKDISSICGINNSLKDIPGFHIRTYISEIDNQKQYFIIHIPKNFRKNRSYPLVFQIPFKLAYNYHYLESMRVADLQLIENLQDITDKNNIIIVEPFAREVGIPNFNCIEETDFFEVLNTVCEDFKIKMDQLYFIGSCQGVHKALKLAVKYPDILAGMAFISPSFHEPYNYSAKNLWIENNEPLNFIKNLRNVPILIIHSKLDDHVPIFSSEQFADFYRINGLSNLEYRQLDDVVDQYYWTEYSDDLIKYLLKHKKIDMPEKITISSMQLRGSKAYWLRILKFSNASIANITAEINNNILKITSNNAAAFSIDLRKLPYKKDKEISIIENSKTLYKAKPEVKELFFSKVTDKKNIFKSEQIEGPFCDAFIHRFTLVVGTQGSVEENKNLRNIVDTLGAMWKYKYWNTCAWKYDKDIAQEDVLNSNLILIGNDNSNIIIKKIIDKLPLQIAKNEIYLNKMKIKGKKLGFYMIYPNPLNSKRYIAIIGYNNPDYITMGQTDLQKDDYNGYKKWLKLKYMEISCYGWYDYRIWDNSNKETIEKGYFTPEWN